jgi:hypothetical protein
MPSKRCRHPHAWPTLYGQRAGFLWCSDCGARRNVEDYGTGYRAVGGWLYPRGHEDVLRQMDRHKRKRKETPS